MKNISMIKPLFISFFLATISLFILSPSLHAAIWSFEATDLYGAASNFSLQFDDSDNDSVVELSDIIPGSFSGVTFASNGYTYETILEIVDLTVDGLTLDTDRVSNTSMWKFESTQTINTMSATAVFWSYSATAVPVPGAIWLLGSGLIGLVGLRKKLKS